MWRSRAPRPWIGWALLARLWALLVVGWLLSTPAFAYPWMIQHQHTGCAQCHVDPSGAGALTEYGRAQGALILPTTWGREAKEPGRSKDFLFGVLPLPDAAIAQAEFRSLAIPRPDAARMVLMQADLRGGVQTDHFVAYASLGVVGEGAQAARLSQGEGAPHLVARDYWIGITPTRGLTVRAGRMLLPFGIRDDNHNRFIRGITRTSTNADQQVGLAVAGMGRGWRGELMAIAGNPQVSPDTFRERGYAGYFAYSPAGRVELGVSSLLTHAAQDIHTLGPRTRQAHGVFTRLSPLPHLAILAEANLLVEGTGEGEGLTAGALVDLEADYEVVQGLHLKGGGELCQVASAEASPLGRGRFAAQWFFLPRINVRIDALYGPLHGVPGAEVRPMALAQLHFYL